MCGYKIPPSYKKICGWETDSWLAVPVWKTVFPLKGVQDQHLFHPPKYVCYDHVAEWLNAAGLNPQSDALRRFESFRDDNIQNFMLG